MEIVQQEKRIQLRHLVIAEGPLQVNTRPFDGRSALPHFADFSYGIHNDLHDQGRVGRLRGVPFFIKSLPARRNLSTGEAFPRNGQSGSASETLPVLSVWYAREDEADIGPVMKLNYIIIYLSFIPQ